MIGRNKEGGRKIRGNQNCKNKTYIEKKTYRGVERCVKGN